MCAAGAENLENNLHQAELALQKCEKLSIASRYAGAIMHEVNNPLAAITNHMFLIRMNINDPRQVLAHVGLVEKQLETLSTITRNVLAFHREQLSAKDFDLME